MAKAKPPTAKQRVRWTKIADLGCLVEGCGGPATINHCFTGAGGRKNHDLVIPLCWHHHLGPEGIDGRAYGMSKKVWQQKYGSEQSYIDKVNELVGMP